LLGIGHVNVDGESQLEAK